MLTVIPFIETTIPVDIAENTCGVALNPLVAKKELKNKKIGYTIEVMSINGIWYGASEAYTNIGGYACPCTRIWNAPFKDVEDCIDYHYNKVYEYFKREGKGMLPDPPLRSSKKRDY